VLSFSVNDAARQSGVFFSRTLVKVALDGCFKSARTLKDHLIHGTNPLEIETVGANPIDADVSDHQHPQWAFSFCFGPHEPSKKLMIG
jgi:hypothetical protein